MTKKFNFIWNLPNGKLSDVAERYVQDYVYDNFVKAVESFSPQHQEKAYETIMDDIVNNNAKEFGKYITL